VDALERFPDRCSCGDREDLRKSPLSQPSSATGQPASESGAAGFTLIEILVAMAIVLTVAAIGVPVYTAALERARVTRAIGDISTLGKEIVTHHVSHGCWPATLDELGRGELRDPWGRPYVVAILAAAGGGGTPGNSGDAGANGRGRGGSNDPPGNSGRGGGGTGNGGCTACGGSCAPSGQARQDGGDPINADFDVYSTGKDGLSAASIGAQPSRDDIIRGRSGSFIGLASSY
jgi:general secretion pathway protein G